MSIAKIVPLPRPSTAEGDEALLARVAASNDTRAFSELHRRHRARIRALTLRLRARPIDEDDLVQEVFVIAWQRADRFDPRRSTVRAWLSGIAVNVVRSQRRADARSRWYLALLGQQPEERGTEPERLTIARQEHGRMWAAIDRMAPKLREAFVLVDVEGHSGVEAAEILSVPKGTVWRRLHEARAFLTAALAKEVADD